MFRGFCAENFADCKFLFRPFTMGEKWSKISYIRFPFGDFSEEADGMEDNTIKFVVPDDSAQEMKAILAAVYRSLSEKGYNPINQIVGYLLSEDPTYITNYNNARSLICKLDRDELLQELVRHYLFD